MYRNTLFLNVVNGDETSDSGREFQMLMECGTKDLWKAFVRAKGWWRRCCLLVNMSASEVAVPLRRFSCPLKCVLALSCGRRHFEINSDVEGVVRPC